MTPEEHSLQTIALVAQVLVRRHGGVASIPVTELIEVAALPAQWDREGDTIIVRTGAKCLK